MSIRKFLLQSLIALFSFSIVTASYAALRWTPVTPISYTAKPVPVDHPSYPYIDKNMLVFVPGSQGLHGNAMGWYLMTTEATPYNTSDFTQDATYLGYDYRTGGAGKKVTSKQSSSAHPITWITRNQAEAACANDLVDPSGKRILGGRLPSFDVWAKMAYDLTSNPDNWYSNSVFGQKTNAVGTGHMSRGHASNSPSSTIAIGTDINGVGALYYETRKHYTTQGNFVWDFAGNVWEWYEDLHGGGGVGAWTEFTSAVNRFDGGYRIDPDWYNTGWGSFNSGHGVGQIAWYNATAGSTYAAIFGGNWDDTAYAGVWTSSWYGRSPASLVYGAVGFRCMVPAQ